jgi:hypothetical protein
MNPTRSASGTKAISKRRSVTNAGRLVALTLILLGTVIFAGGNPASAGRIDCVFASCGFGVTAPPPNTIPTTPLSFPGSFVATLDETVYLNGNTYTYLFTSKSTTLSNNPIGTFATSTLPSPIVGPAVKNFMDGTLKFGIVTTGGPAGNSSPGYSLNDVPAGNTGFDFSLGSLQVHPRTSTLSGLQGGDTLAWYAQAKLAPAPGITTYVDGFASTSGTLDPAPEPSTALLLGLGFPMLSGLVARRRRARSKVSVAIPA